MMDDNGSEADRSASRSKAKALFFFCFSRNGAAFRDAAALGGATSATPFSATETRALPGLSFCASASRGRGGVVSVRVCVARNETVAPGLTRASTTPQHLAKTKTPEEDASSSDLPGSSGVSPSFSPTGAGAAHVRSTNVNARPSVWRRVTTPRNGPAGPPRSAGGPPCTTGGISTSWPASEAPATRRRVEEEAARPSTGVPKRPPTRVAGARRVRSASGRAPATAAVACAIESAATRTADGIDRGGALDE